MMNAKGDANNLDHVTRQRLVESDNEIHIMKLFKLGWFILGIITGSVLHDKLFHAVEQVIK